MKPGKRDIKQLIDTLEGDYEDVEEAAKAVLEKAWDIYANKAQYMVVGQVYYRQGYLNAEDMEYGRVVLGPFTTRKQAEKVGESLAISSATGEQAKWVAIPYWGGTPAAWYNERKSARKKIDAATEDDTPLHELRHQMRVEWLAANPGETVLPEHLQGNGWDDLDDFKAWHEQHEGECPACGGTGRIPGLGDD